MSEMKANMKREEGLDKLIRKQIGSESNRRFLSRMPAFKLDADVPDRLSALLGQLDAAESATSRSKR